jgi:cytochrome b
MRGQGAKGAPEKPPFRLAEHNAMNTSQSEQAPKDRPIPVKVWDLPTRLFHWTLVILVVVSFVSGNIGGNMMTYHMWSGYGILVLLLFRLAWGIAGGRQSRFGAFVRGPGTVVRYAAEFMKSESKPYLGHNPLGGWSVIAMLLALLVQAGTGLFANDDIFTEGPLYLLVSKDVSDWLTDIHLVNRYILIFLVAIHLFAVFYHLVVKRDNLIKPMITGVKLWHGPADASSGSLWAAALIAALAGGAIYLIIGWAG